MKLICQGCGEIIGEKEPYEDESEVSGMCQECEDEE
jgi:hypothetical protein